MGTYNSIQSDICVNTKKLFWDQNFVCRKPRKLSVHDAQTLNFILCVLQEDTELGGKGQY
jgi:hypothetical protein